MRKHRTLTFFFLFFLLPSFVLSQQSLKGIWEGAIKTPGMDLSINIEFNKNSDGSWKGDIDIRQQQAKDLPLTNIKLEGSAVSFDLPNVPGNPSFRGTLAADGKTITGDFTQSGQKFAFNLTRKEEAELAKEAAALEASLQKLRAFIDTTMRVWKVPGLSMAIVKDGKVVFSEGFGYRSLKEKQPVTTTTLFAIGSSTKAFTATCLGILADDGTIKLDDPVKTYLPAFKLKDDFASARMTPRDLVTHRSGLPRHDLLWYGSSFTRKEMVERLQYLEPNKDFRTDWQYQNLMFMTAGFLVEQVTGKTWEDFVKSRIFTPLGMTNSNFSVLESQKSPDYALPYTLEKDSIKGIPFRNITEIGPAGSINSSASDMGKWVMLQLNKGKAGDVQVISEAGLAQIHSPQMVMPGAREFTEFMPTSYGMGWFIQPYRGHLRIQHGGNIDGFSALVSFMPDDNIGMVVLTNMNGTGLPGVVSLYASDLLLKLDPVDWHARFRARIDKAREEEKKRTEKDTERKPGTKPSHPLPEYAGKYENPGYGTITIDHDGKVLKGKFNSFDLSMEHWHYDVFRATAKDNEGMKFMFTFLTNAKGDIEGFTSPLEPFAKEILFTRKPADQFTDPKFLAQLAGEYDLSGQTVKVVLKGTKAIVLIVPGQPQYDLEPYKGTEFNIKGLSGYSVRFTVDEKKGVTEMSFIQPNGIFKAAKKK